MWLYLYCSTMSNWRHRIVLTKFKIHTQMYLSTILQLVLQHICNLVMKVVLHGIVVLCALPR